MKNKITSKTSAFGSRYNMYNLHGAAYAWNPDLKEWEVFETDEDGAVQDLSERFKTRPEAESHASYLQKQEALK